MWVCLVGGLVGLCGLCVSMVCPEFVVNEADRAWRNIEDDFTVCYFKTSGQSGHFEE